MKKQHFSQVEAADVPEPAKGVTIRWLIDETTGAPNFAMRHFEIAPGGNTPLHSHRWEHEVFILSGRGVVTSEQGEDPFAPGDVVFMPGGEEHNFRNSGSEPVTMLCLVPLDAKNK
ncbi:MAG: cupin domain-containing protein [Planctomycetota bacterium]